MVKRSRGGKRRRRSRRAGQSTPMYGVQSAASAADGKSSGFTFGAPATQPASGSAFGATGTSSGGRRRRRGGRKSRRSRRGGSRRRR